MPSLCLFVELCDPKNAGSVSNLQFCLNLSLDVEMSQDFYFPVYFAVLEGFGFFFFFFFFDLL